MQVRVAVPGGSELTEISLRFYIFAWFRVGGMIPDTALFASKYVMMSGCVWPDGMVCILNDAPWLVNGGHGASLRHPYHCFILAYIECRAKVC
jgi:hypothetical protein